MTVLCTLHDEQYGQGMAQLAELQELGLLCNVTIVSGDGHQMNAHKVVLAARIPYFRARFESGLFCSDEITLETIKYSILQSVIAYCYRGRLEVGSWGEVCEILVAADYLQLETLKQQCELVLKKEVCVENCVELCNFSNTYTCFLLKAHALEFAAIHWSYVTEHPSWVNLNHATLQELMSTGKINVYNEDSVLKALLTWIKHDTNREPYFQFFLSEIRLDLVSPQLLVALEHEPYVVNNQECQKLINAANMSIDLPIAHSEVDPQYFLGIEGFRKSRLRTYYGKCIYVFGWHEGPHDSTMAVYSDRNKEWSEQNIPFGLNDEYRSVLTINNVIYLFGETGDMDVDLDADTSTWLSCYDPSRQKWDRKTNKDLIEHINKHNSMAVSNIKDLVIMAGGKVKDSSSPLKDTYLFNTVTDTFKQVKDMGMGKAFGHRMVTLNDKVYCVGGTTWFSGDYAVAENEVYDVAVNQWHPISRMNHDRLDKMALVATDSRLIAIGGYERDGKRHYHFNTEWIDPREGVWHNFVDMPYHSKEFGASVLNDEIYMMGGGKSIGGSSKKVFILDQRKNEWRIGPDMCARMCFCIPCTIY